MNELKPYTRRYSMFRMCFHCAEIKGSSMFYPKIIHRCRKCCDSAWEAWQELAPDDINTQDERPISNSGAWSRVLAKLKRLEVSGYRCEDCGCGGTLDLHHLTYRTWNRERLADVKILCPACHKIADVKRKKSLTRMENRKSVVTGSKSQ